MTTEIKTIIDTVRMHYHESPQFEAVRQLKKTIVDGQLAEQAISFGSFPHTVFIYKHIFREHVQNAVSKHLWLTRKIVYKSPIVFNAYLFVLNTRQDLRLYFADHLLLWTVHF